MTLIISSGDDGAKRVDPSGFDYEEGMQTYIKDHPESIPLYEVKEDINLLVLAREFTTNSGPIDALAVDEDGDLYIIETKLYNNSDKRKVMAQALDYGAALWKHAGDFASFEARLDEYAREYWSVSFRQKLSEYYSLAAEGEEQLVANMKDNLDDGILKFVVLMDELDDRLKDLVIYVNQNSQFDVYAVEMTHYEHKQFDIMLPRLFGAEVKKDINVQGDQRTQWNRENFIRKLAARDEKEKQAAETILSWCDENDVEISWMKNQIGSFILCFPAGGDEFFYPFSVQGNGEVPWNAWHQGDNCPAPFDQKEKRQMILERLESLDGVMADKTSVNGAGGLDLPLSALANPETRDEFFAVCTWVKEELEKS